MGVLRLKVGGVYTDIVQGPAGPMGPQGPQGIQGPAGTNGSDAPNKFDILSSVSLSVATAQIDFTGINSTTYPTLKLLISSPNTTSNSPRLRFNGITTSTYQYSYSYTSSAGSSASGQAGISLDPVVVSGPYSMDLTIDAKLGRAFGLCMTNYMYGTSLWGEESSRPAVTSINLFRDSAANWPVGSRFTLYGLKVA